MKSRKVLLAENRKKKAAELKAIHRDLFIRKLLRRHGITPAHESPDAECFRGYDSYVSNVFPLNNCLIGVIKGCSFCRGSDTGFAQVKLGQINNLGFKCKSPMPAKHPRLWIMQPGDFIKGPIPGMYRVPRQKPKVDAHGHVIRDDREPPGSFGGPASNPFAEPVQTGIITPVISMPSEASPEIEQQTLQMGWHVTWDLEADDIADLLTSIQSSVYKAIINEAINSGTLNIVVNDNNRFAFRTLNPLMFIPPLGIAL